MNIAFITPEFVTEEGFDGGLSNYLYKVSMALKERGHSLYIIVLSDKNETFLYQGINIVRVSSKSKILNLYKFLFRGKLYTPIKWTYYSWKLNRALNLLMQNNIIDVVQFSSLGGTGLFAPKGTVRIGRISSYQPLFEKAYERRIGLSVKISTYLELVSLTRMDKVFGPSQVIIDIISSKIDRPIDLIESPLHLSFDTNNKIYNRYIGKKKYLLFFGTLGTLKGVKEIADIIYELMHQFEDLYFVFVGKDHGYQNKPIMEYVWKNAKEYKNRCLYLGNMTQEYLKPIVKNAYAVVLPSRTDNLPNTCTESMTSGKIVIGTIGASFDQLIENGKNGFLCNINDSESLLKTINIVLQLDRVERLKISTNAKETVKRLDPNYIASLLEAYYIDAIKVNTDGNRLNEKEYHYE